MPHLCTRSVSDFLRIYDDRLTAILHCPVRHRRDVASTARGGSGLSSNRMSVGMPGAIGLHRHEDDVAVPHAALGDDAVRECLDFGAAAFEHRHFQATVVVEMHVEC